MKFKLLSALFILFVVPCLYGQKLHLNLVGKDSVETRLLNGVEFNASHENIKSVYDETAIIQNTFYKRGYFQNTIDSIIKKDTLCNAYFSLGEKIDFIKAKVDKKYIDVLKGAGIKIVNDSIKIKPSAFESTLYKISKRFEAKGDPFSEISLTDMEIKNRLLSGKLSISETEIRKVDKIFVKGYEKFPLSFVKHIGKIKTGALFNSTEIGEKAEKLNQLPYVNQIKPPEILFSKDATHLYIYIEKVNANYFDGFLGFATDKDTRRLKLNGYLDVRLLNNLNTGEQLTISWKNNGSKQSTFKADATVPYLFRSAFGVQAAIHILKQDSTFTNTATTALLNYSFNANANAGLGIENIESASLLNIANPEINISDYTSFFIKSAYNYILRNEDLPVFNEKMKVNLALSAGSRKILNTTTGQQKLYSDISYQWNLNYKNRIYIRNLTELLLSGDYLYNEKYRFGGINSIRGFNENSLEATFYNVINTEYRLLLSKSLYLNSIFDIAYFKDNILKTDATLYGFGFGLGAITSGGLLKINYAIGKSEEAPVRFSNAKIHLSFSTFF